MADNFLEARHISKAYAGVQALDDVSLTIGSGAIHCLVGENGSGKSTLIKVIGGVVTPEQGELVYDGSREKLLRDYARHKVIAVHLQTEHADRDYRGHVTGPGMELVEHDGELLRLRVPRDEVAGAAAHVLANLPVRDLSIEEPEIGTIIESLQQGR